MNKTILPLFLLFAFTAFGQNPLYLEMSEEFPPEPGQEYEVQIAVTDFTQLFSVQFFVLWDPEVIQIEEVSFFNDEVPMFDNSAVTLPKDDNDDPSLGKMRIGWGTSFPVSLPDESHLMTLKFNTVGNLCDTTSLRIGPIGTNQNEIIEVVDENFEDVGAYTNNMRVKIPGPNCLTSTHQLADATELSLYPNPVKTTLNVDIKGVLPMGSKINFFDSKGQRILDANLPGQNNQIDLTNMPASIYHYEIQHSNAVLAKGKIIKI